MSSEAEESASESVYRPFICCEGPGYGLVKYYPDPDQADGIHCYDLRAL